jgi:DNA-binding NarL/FixJ family response regulator
MASLLSIIESSMHPNFGDLYKKINISETRTDSIRKALALLKTDQPDFIVCEFFYGYGNNYAGVNISNLDVLLSTLQKYAPNTHVIVIVDKSERQYVDKLNDLLPLHEVLIYPAKEKNMEHALTVTTIE